MKLRLAAALAALVLLAACRREAPATAPAPATPAPTPAAATPAPAPAAAATTAERPRLRLPTVDGGEYDLAAHRGKWVVVNFWATWCGPCLKEMPELSALDAMREHVEVVGLAFEDTTPEAMREFLKAHPVVYPIALVDVYDPPADFAVPRGLPMTYLVAPDGRVARSFTGPVTARDLEQAIAAAGGPKSG
jgi:thiol-disulfide isomerase/thioredoxin